MPNISIIKIPLLPGKWNQAERVALGEKLGSIIETTVYPGVLTHSRQASGNLMWHKYYMVTNNTDILTEAKT